MKVVDNSNIFRPCFHDFVMRASLDFDWSRPTLKISVLLIFLKI